MAGWKILELNGGFRRKITVKWSIFQPAMFDDTGGYRDSSRIPEIIFVDAVGALWVSEIIPNSSGSTLKVTHQQG